MWNSIRQDYLNRCARAWVVLALLSCRVLAQDPEQVGEWSDPIDLKNVAVHAHVLPNGKVLYWGRREWNANTPAEDLDPHNCTPRLWDPKTGTITETPQPGFNLFCGGHTFLADGRLFVVGGHILDSVGEKRATIYDPEANTWSEAAPTNKGRWYPTLITLADGGVLVISGSSFGGPGGVNTDQQVWKDGLWRGSGEHNTIPLYPRMHLATDGRVFLAGHLKQTQLLDTNKADDYWEAVAVSAGKQREDGCSVMYEPGKVLIVGGGRPPQETAEIIDLEANNPTWKNAASMKFKRRHHNATLLPDGTVLVTGGTRGQNGAGTNGFNDVSANQPVHIPELWDANAGAGGTWTELADEEVDRCYHSTAVLLPDARVLSAGGGEWRPFTADPQQENDHKDSRRDAKVFSPPYLFKSTAAKPRPDITSAPNCVKYGQDFVVKTSHADQVGQVNLLALSSVTHQCNLNQRINFLAFDKTDATTLTVTAPAKPELCPPGYYMMFVLNTDKVPSVAKMIRVP